MQTVPEIVLGWLDAAFKILGEGDRKVIVHLETPRTEQTLPPIAPDDINFEHLFATARSASKKTIKGDIRLHFVAEVDGRELGDAMTIVVKPGGTTKCATPDCTKKHHLRRGYCPRCRSKNRHQDSSDGGT